MTEHASLVHLSKARQELALMMDVDTVKDLRDKAEALRVYRKQAGEGLEAQNECAEIKIRAERRAGELLAEREMAKGAREPATNRGMTRSDDVTASPRTLEEMEISRNQSSDWQAIATIPEESFEATIARTREERKELTSAQMLRKARRKPPPLKPEPDMGDRGFCSAQQTNVVNDVIANLRNISTIIREKAKRWIAPNRAMVEEALADAILAMKETRP